MPHTPESRHVQVAAIGAFAEAAATIVATAAIHSPVQAGDLARHLVRMSVNFGRDCGRIAAGEAVDAGIVEPVRE